MNWITNLVRPKVKGAGGAKGSGGDMPENLWKKCPSCGEMIFHRDLVAAQNVCPNCGYHMRIGPQERFAAIFDGGAFDELPAPTVPAYPLNYRGQKRYPDEMKGARTKTQRQEALSAARLSSRRD